MNAIKFQKDTQPEFFKTLQTRINRYFKTNNIAKTGNTKAYVKAVILLTCYIGGIVSIYFSASYFQLYFSYIVIGSLSIFVALNIAHDAAHNTFSKHRKVNEILLYTFDLLGANGYMWRLKHVYSHHPHVNIPNMDGDIKQSNLVRIFPNAPFLRLHQYQYLYMPFLYLLYTLVWLLFRDFRDFFNTDISGKPNIKHHWTQFLRLFLGKSFYISNLLILPTLLLPFSFSEVLLGFVLMNFTASMTVAMALISAHVGEESVYPQPDENGLMPSSWVLHQIATTTDFATKSPIITHLFGGFNHHVVHHLFPNICHIHYPELTKIVKTTCAEFGIKYNLNPRLIDAIVSHLRFLKMRSDKGLAVEYIEM